MFYNALPSRYTLGTLMGGGLHSAVSATLPCFQNSEATSSENNTGKLSHPQFLENPFPNLISGLLQLIIQADLSYLPFPDDPAGQKLDQMEETEG